MAVTVVGRWPLYRGLNKGQCMETMDCPPGKERWPLVEFRLYFLSTTFINSTVGHLQEL